MSSATFVKALVKKNKKRKVESPILNLSEESFKYQKQFIIKNKLPNIKKLDNKNLNLSQKLIKNHLKETNSSLSIIKNKNNSNINKGTKILSYNDKKIYIPKLIIPKGKINFINSFSADRQIYLSQIQNRAKNNKNLYTTKRMEQLFLQKEEQKKINEVLNIYNDNNYFRINKKKFMKDFNLLERLGIFKLNK